MKLFAAGLTDTGRRRSRNEDSFIVDGKLGLLIVADGLGGHAAGETASRLAVESVREHLSRCDRQGRIADLAAAVEEANRRIHAEALRLCQHPPMGTTVAVAWCVGPRLLLAHVGDSRVYLLRQGWLERLTEDHSLVAEQSRKGLISPGEAETSPLRNVVTRVLGVEARVESEVRELPLQFGDRLLLCSDGLTTMLPEETIAAMALESSSPAALCRRLVELANLNGGEDNITVLAGFCLRSGWRYRLKQLLNRIGG